MIKELRSKFNNQFSTENYNNMLDEIEATYGHRPTFHISETPVFIPNDLKAHLLKASNDIISVIEQPDFKVKTEGSFFDPKLKVPNETDQSRFLALDFGVCKKGDGTLIPQLIELQGFSTLNYFQYMLAGLYKKHFNISSDASTHPTGSRASYLKLLKQEIVGDCDPKEVVLIDVEPEKQNTRIDFIVTAHELGIKVLCVSKIIKEGTALYYLDENGQKVRIRRIFNRVIFDELHQRTDLVYPPIFTEEIDAEWIGHPNWFYRISKYTLPLLKSKYVPDCYFLDQLDTYPSDLENYVLKPLYSFAGAGVKLHITAAELDEITNRKNYILQKKVSYEPVVETLDEPAKCEIRVIAIYNSETRQYQIVNNLVRLSKGEMIGVKYNKNKTWVGGTIGFFEGI